MGKNVMERYLGGRTDSTWKLMQRVGEGGHLEQLSDGGALTGNDTNRLWVPKTSRTVPSCFRI